jgi:hypothetical protein
VKCDVPGAGENAKRCKNLYFMRVPKEGETHPKKLKRLTSTSNNPSSSYHFDKACAEYSPFIIMSGQCQCINSWISRHRKSKCFLKVMFNKLNVGTKSARDDCAHSPEVKVKRKGDVRRAKHPRDLAQEERTQVVLHIYECPCTHSEVTFTSYVIVNQQYNPSNSLQHVFFMNRDS